MRKNLFRYCFFNCIESNGYRISLKGDEIIEMGTVTVKIVD
jgi:hypothetical protein